MLKVSNFKLLNVSLRLSSRRVNVGNHKLQTLEKPDGADGEFRTIRVWLAPIFNTV
jgi:hypothetical protein